MNDQAKQVVNITESMRVVSRELTPMDMLHQAVSQGANIDVLSKLMDLSERWEKNQARKAFDVAIAGAKSEIPVIEKNRNVKFKSKSAGSADTDYWHEDLAQIARTVDPILSKHGLSYRFRATSAPNEPVSVTCVLSHVQGHFEETTLRGPPDGTGNKNPHQAIASACTLLQRYTLRLGLGLAAGKDDDGKAAGGDLVSEEQVESLMALITEIGTIDLPKFLKYLKLEKLTDLRAKDYQRAVDAAESKRAKK